MVPPISASISSPLFVSNVVFLSTDVWVVAPIKGKKGSGGCEKEGGIKWKKEVEVEEEEGGGGEYIWSKVHGQYKRFRLKIWMILNVNVNVNVNVNGKVWFEKLVTRNVKKMQYIGMCVSPREDKVLFLSSNLS